MEPNAGASTPPTKRKKPNRPSQRKRRAEQGIGEASITQNDSNHNPSSPAHSSQSPISINSTQSATPARASRSKMQAPTTDTTVATRQTRPTSPPKSNLKNLPTELLLRIMDYVEMFRSFKALSETSSRLNDVSNEILYDTYDFWREPYLFLRTIMANPKLGENVRTVRIGDYLEGSQFQNGFRKHVDDMSIFRNGFQKLGFPGWEEWLDVCRDYAPCDGHEPMLYTAILMYTPGITTLEIDVRRYSFPQQYWFRLFDDMHEGDPIGNIHKFVNLRSVTFCADKMDITLAEVFFRHESIRVFKIYGMHDATRHVPGPTQPSLSHNFWSDSSDIEELVIEISSLDVNTVAVMLEAIRKLKRFEMPVHEDEYSFKNEWIYSDWLGWMIGRPSFDYDPETMTHPALVQGLYRHRDTLESLDIDGGVSDHDTTNTLGFNGFLHYFHRLKHLVAPFGALAGTRCPSGPEFVESLPVTLESLKIVIRSFDADDDKVKQKDLGRMEPIEYLAENFQSQVPHLKSVMVVCEIKSSEFEYDWERLRTPFLERGVQFDFEQYGKDELDELSAISSLPKPEPWWPIRGRTIEFDTDDSEDTYGGESDFDGFVLDY